MRKIYDQGGSLAEACCKRKYQQSNEVGEDDEDQEGFFRDPSEMYAEAFGFGAGACVAGCCGGGQGFDPFAQFRRYGIIPNGEPHDHSHEGHDHHHDDDSEDYDSEEDYSSEDYEDVDEEQSVKGDPDEGEDDNEEEAANSSKTENEDDGEPQMKKRKTDEVVQNTNA